MALREVLQFPDPRLKQVSEPIDEITDEIRELACDMCQVMYDEPGIGLAAMQLGEAVRLFVLGPMLLISAWHIVENDLALAWAYRHGMRLGPVPRSAAHHAIVLVATALLVVLALATPTGAYYLHLTFDARPPILLPPLPAAYRAYRRYYHRIPSQALT